MEYDDCSWQDTYRLMGCNPIYDDIELPEDLVDESFDWKEQTLEQNIEESSLDSEIMVSIGEIFTLEPAFDISG